MARQTQTREAFVVTMSITFDTAERSYFFRQGDEVWSDDPVVPLLRRHSGYQDIVVPKSRPRSEWPDFVAAAKYGGAVA